MPVCKLCKHLYDPAEPHECPTPEYIQARDALIHDAALAEEMLSEEELAQFAFDLQPKEDK